MALTRRTLSADTNTATTGTTISVTPTGQQDGDWVIIGVIASGGTGALSNTAGGLSRAQAADIAMGTVAVAATWKKKCGAGESGTTYTFQTGSGSNRRWAVAVLCYSGGDPTDIVESAPAGTSVVGTTIDATGVDPANTGATHVIWVFERSNADVDVVFTAPTNYTKLQELYSGSAGSTNANLASITRALPDASATGDQTVTSDTNDRLGVASILLKAGLVVTVEQVTETDTAQTLTRVKTVAVGRASTTNTAQAITARKTAAVGQVTETDSARTLTAVKVVALGRVTETNVAQPIASRKTVTLGQVTETDLARVVTPVRTYAVGRATETDSAQSITWKVTRLVDRATETDAARGLTTTKTAAVDRATETDVAGALTSAKVTALNRVTETDTAATVTATRVEPVGRATETDAARAITSLKTAAVGQVTETDEAGAVAAAGDKTVPVDVATESDTARGITARKTGAVTAATETDVARGLTTQRTYALGRALESELAGALTALKLLTVGRSLEVDLARGVAGVKTLGGVTETDTARDVTCVDCAQAPPEEVDLMTLAFIIVTGIGECVRDELDGTEGGVPDRICLAVPGEIAWDNCECGQFAQSITGDAPANVFPIAATEVAHNACGPPLLVFTVTASVTRCVPTIDENGNPPSCDALLTAARILEDDREAVRKSVTCCLRELRQAYRVTDFAVGATQSVGPQGLCAGVQITYQFGLNYTCC